MLTRQSVLDRLPELARPDVLIVGGGINGIGLFRDLALQGVPALLVDKGDFCSGTSAAPSRLIHGGLRYLETGEFALVRESVEERNRLLIDAPHLVRPIRVWVPLANLTDGAVSAVGRFLRLVRTPGPKGAAVVKIGLMAYDVFNRTDRTMPNHRMVPAAEFRHAMPDLAPSTRYVGEYYDAKITAPERLGLELVADAEAACPGALAANYVAAVGRRGDAVELRDEIGGRSFEVRPRLVVNCAGPWLDGVNGALGIEGRLIGGTKGSHLVLRHPDFAGRLGDVMLYFETHDHRACLAYALDDRHVLLGTTDIRTGDPDDTICSAEEIDYLFGVMTQVMPDLALRREDIVFTYAGVRPLPLTTGVAGAISRDHTLRSTEPGPDRPFPVLSLVGGKWTTYRACAEEMADDVLARLGKARRTGTKGRPIGGGAGCPSSDQERLALARAWSKRFGSGEARTATLLDRYGTAAESYLASLDGPDRMLASLPRYSEQEIACIARNERVARLSDIVLRRSLVGLLGEASPEAITEIGGIAGAALGWSPDRLTSEIQSTERLIATHHGVPRRDEP
jgi:glycerol-3-phosphate dehydrogenase